MLMTIYFLVWPVMSAIILVLLVGNLVRDWRIARKTGESMV
ncbi:MULTISPECIES: putative transporter small subunit [Alcaligenes]|uniref:Transporter small subunit n=1 Tax=Alcaligenes phenolicus TaxID=232846 RepID=A0AAW5VYE4_9BURK|nr:MULTISPECIES: putative transporter small subunit [Alcaligenes]MCR4145582.1 putative transporter small subunit [Alcaligenes faecalis]MCX5565903.1 putative transporter small subunit [Alcaligenes phenolicus]